MNIDNLTVAQISELLDEDNISICTIRKLKADSRISVMRLIERWELRQQKKQMEEVRIKKLYVHEEECVANGYQYIAGVDEAGRGPLAGPVVVAAVILPLGCHLPMLNDSKKLTANQRTTLYHMIKKAAIAVNRISIEPEMIDEINIYNATVHGMYQVIAGLSTAPQAVLVDAVPLRDLKVYAKSIIGGDAVSASIAAASIIAKVERDQFMERLDQQFPHYGFAKHKGYGTKEHLAALSQYGPCPAHRQSFQPVREWQLLKDQAALF